MNLLISLVLLSAWLAIDAPNIGDTPFSQLTLNMIFRSIASIACLLGAIYYASKSLESERIWPWRWTKLYFATLLLKGFWLLLTVVGVWYLWLPIGKIATWMQWVGGIGIVIWVLNILFSDEFNFEEKAIKKLLSKTLVEDNPCFDTDESEASATGNESDPSAPKVKLKPYAGVIGGARRDAVEAYVRKRIIAGDTKTPDVTELWTEDGQRIHVTFGQ